nr:hypothetical protein BN993_03418 [Virgibacillus halodenitrificans]
MALFSRINEWVVSNSIGDYSSVIGLLISLVGFAITICVAISSRNAAQQAREAVKSVKFNLRRGETVSDFSSALATMDEIKRVHRAEYIQYELLAERYSELRKLLVVIKSENPVITEDDNILIQDAITQLGAFERLIDDELSLGNRGREANPAIKAPKHNKLLLLHIDNIHTILVRLKNEAES